MKKLKPSQYSYVASEAKKPKMIKDTSDKDEKYKVWHNRIHSALQWRANHKYGTKVWDRCYELYKGEHWSNPDDEDLPKSDARRDRVTVNVIGSTVQNFIPFFISSRPKFVLHPQKPDSVLSASLQQSVVNYEYKERKMHKQVKRSVLDCVICGTGIIKTGYNIELDEAINTAEGEIVYADYIKAEASYARRVSPYNFIFDPCSSENDLSSADWCAEIIYMKKVDILNNSNYLKSTINAIKGGMYTIQSKKDLMNPDRSILSDDFEYTNEDDEMSVCFEVWSRRHRKYFLFASGVLPPLVEKDFPYPYLDGFPYIQLEFIPNPECPFPFGLPYALEDQQLELNASRTRMFQHGRRFNRKYEVLKNVEESEADKLVEAPDGTYIIVPQVGSINPIADAPLSQDQLVIEGTIKEDIRQISGADALIQGGALPSRTTAGEVNARGSLFRLKLEDRVEAIENGILELAAHTLQHCQANMIKSRVVKIVGPEGEYWQEFTVEDIQDPVGIEMESVSAPRTDPQIMRQQALQMFQILMSQMQVIMGLQIPINWVELFKWMFEKMEIRDVGRFFAPSLVPNQPLNTQPVSNNLNTGSETEEPNTELQSVEDIERQFNLGSTLNQSGLQV